MNLYVPYYVEYSMNRRRFLGACCTVPLIGAAGCLGDDEDPTDVLDEYLEAVTAGDQEEAEGVVHARSEMDVAADIERMEGGTIDTTEADELESVLDRLGYSSDVQETIIAEEQSVRQEDFVDDEGEPLINEYIYAYYAVSVDGDTVEDYALLADIEDLWWVIGRVPDPEE